MPLTAHVSSRTIKDQILTLVTVAAVGICNHLMVALKTDLAMPCIVRLCVHFSLSFKQSAWLNEASLIDVLVVIERSSRVDASTIKERLIETCIPNIDPFD